jgi:hypothetical protein
MKSAYLVDFIQPEGSQSLFDIIRPDGTLVKFSSRAAFENLEVNEEGANTWFVNEYTYVGLFRDGVPFMETTVCRETIADDLSEEAAMLLETQVPEWAQPIALEVPAEELPLDLFASEAAGGAGYDLRERVKSAKVLALVAQMRRSGTPLSDLLSARFFATRFDRDVSAEEMNEAYAALGIALGGFPLTRYCPPTQAQQEQNERDYANVWASFG